MKRRKNKAGLFAAQPDVLTSDAHQDSHLQGAPVNQAVPPGVMLPFAGNQARIPSGWFQCDGRAISRTLYPALFAAIDTTYGNGNGTTTFNLPDLTARLPMGTGGGAGSIGNTGGTFSHTHSTGGLDTANQNQSHVHNITGSTSSDTHSHSNGSLGTGTTGDNADVASGAGASRSTSAHSHAVTGSTATDAHSHTAGTLDTANANQGHTHGVTGTVGTSNPPFLAVNYIIKA